MKNILPLILLISFCSFSQETAPISGSGSSLPEPPTNVIITLNQIIGNASPITTVKIDIDGNDIAEYTIVVNIKGYFEQKFTPPLPMTIDGKLPKISVWCENQEGIKSQIIPYTVETPESILEKLKLKTLKLPSKALLNTSQNPEINGAQPVSSTFRYNVRMLNTNFTIPIARFNLTKSDGVTSKQGDILLFNSIGAGVGISWGQLEKTTDATGETINLESTNTFGIQLGVLFSAGSSNSESKNVFAPSISISILDFQIGYGHELGTLATNQKKGFFTLAYAIPISKLIKGKFYLFKASKGYNSKNPLPDDTTTGSWITIHSFVQ